VNSGIGFIIGAVLPKLLQEGMTVALYAMFIGLLVPSMKKGFKVVFLAGLSACFNSFFFSIRYLKLDGQLLFLPFYQRSSLKQ
jgi:predicted branched-subunit amino acid permease